MGGYGCILLLIFYKNAAPRGPACIGLLSMEYLKLKYNASSIARSHFTANAKSQPLQLCWYFSSFEIKLLTRKHFALKRNDFEWK
eukprot:SAG31_NODE_3982_length_3691_cov_7.523664_3_plen_85_part_00